MHLRLVAPLLLGLIGAGLPVLGQTLDSSSQDSTELAYKLDYYRKASPATTARNQAEFWMRTLGLTRAQAMQIKQISRLFAENVALVAQSSMSDADKAAAISTYDAERESGFRSVLDSKQQDRYLAYREQLDLWVKQKVQPAAVSSQ